MALVLAGCGFDVAGDQPMAAAHVYRTWWAKTEACSGLAGDFDRIQWEVVPGGSFACSSGQCAGPFGEGCPLTWATWTGSD